MAVTARLLQPGEPARVQFHARDIWHTPDDGKRYEVIDGALYVSPPPDWIHQSASGNLYGILWSYIRPRRLGKIVTAPVGVVLDEHNGVEPDLVYVSQERARIITRRGVVGAPDLVVEVLSPSTAAQDRGVKMNRYAAAGVAHYWILDPRRRTLTPFRLTDGGYIQAGAFGPGSVFEPELFPGLEIPIDELWD